MINERGVNVKHVVVTGGTGFIGSWLIQELLGNKINVTAIVRDKKKLLEESVENPMLHIIEKSILDVDETDFKSKNYDCFFHLAWDGVAPEKKKQCRYSA